MFTSHSEGLVAADFEIATAFAFGLSVVAMAYSIGNISGCHINPAISLGMFLSKRISLKDFLFYVLFQTLGAIIAGGVLLLLAINFGGDIGLGTNAVQSVLTAGETSGKQYVGGLFLGLLTEILLTFIFVLAAIGVTSKAENGQVAGLVIGLTLTLVHLMGIPLTGTSVNPARSIGPALWEMYYGNYEPIKEIWIFIVGPLAGAALAAVVYNFLAGKCACKKEGEAK
jgi:aquaporin Z